MWSDSPAARHFAICRFKMSLLIRERHKRIWNLRENASLQYGQWNGLSPVSTNSAHSFELMYASFHVVLNALLEEIFVHSTDKRISGFSYLDSCFDRHYLCFGLVDPYSEVTD